MESPRLEEQNIIKDVRYLFRLEKLRKKIIDTIIKDIRNLFRIKKENKVIILKTEYLEILETFLN